MAKNHGRILSLIEAGDELRAVDAIGEHIRGAYTRIWSTLAEPAPSVQMTPSQLDTAKSFSCSNRRPFGTDYPDRRDTRGER